jgi:hypothetical protein
MQRERELLDPRKQEYIAKLKQIYAEDTNSAPDEVIRGIAEMEKAELELEEIKQANREATQGAI